MKKQKTSKTTASKKNILLILSILAVVAVSGCISLGDLFGSSETKVEASPDVMSFSDSTVIPNPPILTGDTFTTSFAMKNLDEFEDAKNVKIELYDWGVCTPSSCIPSKKDNVGWDAIDNTKSQTSYSAAFNDISPKDVQQIECQFKSPSSEKIGGLDARCPIRYKLTYDFSGITTTELNIISNKKFQDMQRAGQTPSVTSTQSKSRGPIKVDFSFGVNQPARTSSADSEIKIPMYIRVENKGSGKTGQTAITKTVCQKQGVKGNSACESMGGKCLSSTCGLKREDKGCSDQPAASGDCGCTATCDIGSSFNMSVKIPAALTSSGKTDKCSEIICDGFFSGSADGTDTCKLTLTSKADFVKDKSQVFRCELTSPDEKVVTDMKTYSIQSEVKYTYQIDNDFNVAIRPMTFG